MDIALDASEMVQLDAPVPNGHFVGQNNSENNCIHRFLSRKVLKVFLILSVIVNIILVVILIVSGKIHGQQSHGLVSHTPCPLPCPSDWLLKRGKCYYFSTEERNWTSSQDFCSLYNASLATIENEEKAFVMEFRKKVPYWIGLRRHSGQPWKWLNGQIATLQVLGEGEDCACLVDEVEAKASISRCTTEHHWICSKSSNPTET